MKLWQKIALTLGPVLLLASLLIYVGQVTSCYPSAEVWKKFSSEEQAAFSRVCHLAAGPTSRFDSFLYLFLTGVLLFTIILLRMQPGASDRRSLRLGFLLVILLGDGLLMTLAGLLSYPLPWEIPVSPVWVMELIAALGFLIYMAGLGLWYWRRWGLYLLLPSVILLAVLVVLSRWSLTLALVPILAVILLLFFLRPIRKNLT